MHRKLSAISTLPHPFLEGLLLPVRVCKRDFVYIYCTSSEDPPCHPFRHYYQQICSQIMLTQLQVQVLLPLHISFPQR